MAAHVLGRDASGGAQFTHGDAEFLVEGAHPFHSTMDIDSVMMAARAQFTDDTLRLAQRVGADQHAAVWIGMERGEQPVHLAAGIGVAEDGEAEGRFGHENVARDRLERQTGRVGAALVIARHHHPFAAMFQHDLRRSQHMAGGDITDGDAAHPHFLAIADRGAAGGAIAQTHDRQRLARRPDMAMAATRMIGVAVGYQRPFLRQRRIDPGIGGTDIDSGGVGFDPVGHGCRRWERASRFRKAISPKAVIMA